MTDEIKHKETILEGTISEVRDFLEKKFHEIKHSDSFSLILTRLEIAERELAKAKTTIHKFDMGVVLEGQKREIDDALRELDDLATRFAVRMNTTPGAPKLNTGRWTKKDVLDLFRKGEL